MTVLELESRMGHDELLDWMEFERLEPFPSFRLEFGFAHVCATLANINRKKEVRAFNVDEFMPFHNALVKEHDRQYAEEVLEGSDEDAAALLDTVLKFGGRIVKRPIS